MSTATLFCGRCRRAWPAGSLRVCPVDATALVPLPVEREGRVVRPDPGPPPPVRTLAQAARAHPVARWLPEPWRRLLGSAVPARGWSALVFGQPGTGKSTCLLALLAVAVLAGLRVLLLDTEMRAGAALTAILRSSRVPPELHDRIRVAAVGAVSHIDDLLVAERPDLAVVDSLMPIAAEPGDLARWREQAGAVVGVLHVTKSGDARGDSRFLHDCDAVVRFLREGASTDKSRFGAAPGAAVPFDDLLWRAAPTPAETDPSAPEPVDNVVPLRGPRRRTNDS